VFESVRRSRDAGIEKVTTDTAAGKKLAGWQVDKATRDVLASAGYSQYLNNQVGHSIIRLGLKCMEMVPISIILSLVMSAKIILNTCFSIEPGIYLPDFGLRSEVNV
jgi:Xaa-Pro dipeptidase